MNDQERVALLTSRLGLPELALHPELALQALRHGSFVHERSLAPGREQLRSNERLEFLGDAVLGFLIARRFYERLPDASEGDLTRRRASVVREESLAIAARELGLGELLLVGRAEQRSGMQENPARLADALEAVLGAVYLSCGMDRAQEVLERVLAPLFENGRTLGRDPKTELQELLQSRRRVPQYNVLAVDGPPHARAYQVEVRLDVAPLDVAPLGVGAGRTKKEAEQAAARAALEDPGALEQALLDEPVTLEPHDPRWAALAADEIARLRGSLGPDACVEHIGSTAVPGLVAKPIIDLLVGVADLAQPLRLSDYEAFGEAGMPGRRYFRKRGALCFNAQAVVHQGPLWSDALLLREFLRAHPGQVERYAQGKREALAAGGTLLAYSKYKAPLIADLLARARTPV